MHANNRISDIEVLSAVAVLFVIFQHLRNLFPWPMPVLNELYQSVGGRFGVDLFFAVSGFVIARDLIPRLREVSGWAEQRRIMGAFWLRRIWRLWPAAWLWLGLILLAVLFLNESGAFGTLAANLQATIAGVFNFANIRFAETFMRSEYGASFVYWSLSLEEQFYLLFPLLILLLRQHLAWFFLIIALLQIITPRQSHPYLMMFRTDALALGVLLAMWSQRASWRLAAISLEWLGRRACQMVLVAGVICMALLSTPGSMRYGIGLIALISAGLVLIAAHDRDLLLAPGRLKSVLVWCGERSYALYLIHVPAFFLTREIFFRIDPLQPFSAQRVIAYLLCSLLIILVTTELNYRLVEAPLRRFGARFSERLLYPIKKVSSEGSAHTLPIDTRQPG
ncbi:acyltransferase family protein [Pseudomonas alcaligenes]|uniref:acyltransferase family protein n=1 Tax=Aquipseudomonas alcaligenes TaxID=43263 RepID=UPI00358E6C58